VSMCSASEIRTTAAAACSEFGVRTNSEQLNSELVRLQMIVTIKGAQVSVDNAGSRLARPDSRIEYK
jgi:hypothetical protein